MRLIDAVPVVRGEWKLCGNDDDSGMSYWCTVCNFQLSEDLFYSGYDGRWVENGVFKYCPNCGAKMEVESSIFFEKEPKPAIEKYNARLTHVLDEEYCNLLDDYEVVQCEFYEDRVEVLWKHYRNDEVKKTTGEDVVEALNKLILHLAKEWEQRMGNKAE